MGDLMGQQRFIQDGRRLGVYQVQGLLGAGGMGEVYQARDTRLGRDVALKFLPPTFMNDPEWLARFEREARMLAAVNHPNIGAIYNLEDVEGMRFLVLELVDGKTLAETIGESSRGSSGLSGLPVRSAVNIARQVARALDFAHQRGIIHRDLKPANIKITSDGSVKVLDFGLAKVSQVECVPAAAGQTTMTRQGTNPGTVMGTAAYMSPEQARGQPLDKRTDIWAFGCVLYELLTGRIAFGGATTSDTIAAVLVGEPAWEVLPHDTPASVRQLLQRCLEKDPARRLRDLGDVQLEGEPVDGFTAQVGGSSASRSGVQAPGALSGPGPATAGATGSSRLYVPAVLALVVLAAGAALLYSMRRVVPATASSDYTQLTHFTDSATAPSLSLDGRMLAFKRGEDSFLSSGQIYVKLLPNGESVQLTNGPKRKFGPVFTPDGSRIAYSQFTPGVWDTWTVPVLGGPPTELLPNASGLTWIADHQVLFSEIQSGVHMGIVTATESRADRRQIYIRPNEHAMAHYSYLSPDRKSVLVVEMNGTHAFTEPCRLVPFDGNSAGRQVGPRGTCLSAAWSPDGEWMYFGALVQGSSHLWRQKYPDGAPEQITFGPLEEEGIAMAADGRSLVTSAGTRRSAIWIHDSSGERAVVSEGYAASPRLSRDGTHIFYLLVRDWWLSASGWVPSAAELHSVNLASGETNAFLPGVSVIAYDLSAEEKDVAFTATDSTGGSQVWVAPLDRRTPPRQISKAGDQVSFAGPDTLVFRSLETTTNELVRINKDGSGREQITNAPVLDKLGVSPDGAWVLVSSPEAGRTILSHTVAVPTRGGAPRVVCTPRCDTDWSTDGRTFYLSTAFGKTLAIPLAPGQSLPDIPPLGLDLTAGDLRVAGAQVIARGSSSAAPDRPTYVFTRTDLQRNLFRVPLH
jgi:Tol biopolymer transport system component